MKRQRNTSLSTLDSSVKFTSRLIELYKNYPEMWDTNHEFYRSPTRKIEVWNAISKDLDVDIKTCRRKLESVLASFRNVRKKWRLCSGENFKTTWRYWDSLYFLRGQAEESSDVVALEDDAESNDVNSSFEKSKTDSKNLPKRKREPSPPKTEEIYYMDVPSGGNAQFSNFNNISTQGITETPMHVAPVAMPYRHEDEYTAVGITVESKLRKMQYDQRLYAENLINQALFKGLLFQLTEHSKIVTERTDKDNRQPAFVNVESKKRKKTRQSHDENEYDNLLELDESNGLNLLEIKTRVSESSDDE